jgi:hypothetical protein
MKNNICITEGRQKSRIVTNVANGEIQSGLGILVYDVVGCGSPVKEFEPHVMLFGLIAGKDRDLLGPAHFAREHSLDQDLSERPCAACYQDPFSFQFIHLDVRS